MSWNEEFRNALKEKCVPNGMRVDPSDASQEIVRGRTIGKMNPVIINTLE